MSRFYIWIKPWAESTSQIIWEIQEKSHRNYMDSGVTDLSVVSFIMGMPLSYFTYMLRIRDSRRWYWGTNTMTDSFNFSLDTRTASVSERGVLKPPPTWCSVYLQMNAVIPGVHADAWVLWVIYLNKLAPNGPGITPPNNHTGGSRIGVALPWADIPGSNVVGWKLRLSRRVIAPGQVPLSLT